MQPTHGLPSEWGEGVGTAHSGTLMALQIVRVGLPDGSATRGGSAGGGGPGRARWAVVGQCDGGPTFAQMRRVAGVGGSWREAQTPVTL